MDFEFENNGSLYMIYPMTDAAREHAAEVYEDALTFGGGIAVDPRYAPDNAAMLLQDGFRVSVDGQEIELADAA